MSSIGRKIVSSTIWSAVESWAREATVFLVFIILARLLGPEAIGLAALAMSAPYILMIPVQQGIPQALVQRQDIEPIHLDSAFWFLLAVGAALTGLIWFAAPLIAHLIGSQELADLVKVTSLTVVLTAVGTIPGVVMARGMLFRLSALCRMTSAVIGVVIGLGLALRGYGVWSLVLMYVGRTAVESAIVLVGCGWRPRMRYSHEKCRELFGFAAPVFGHAILAVANTEAPKVMLGAFLGPGAVGIYTLARRPIDLLVNMLILPVAYVALPAVAQMETSKLNRFVDIGIRLAATLCFPAFVGFAAIAPVLIPPALGPQWVGAILSIQIFALYGLHRSIADLCSYTVLALGHARLLFRMQLLNTMFTAILTAAAAAFSVEAVAGAIVLCHSVMLVILLLAMRRTAGLDVRTPLRILPPLLVVTGAMALAVTGWTRVAPESLPGFAQAGIGIAIGIVVFTALASWLLQTELLMLRDLLLRGRSTPAESENLGAVGS
jgi:O-antigen/teichoic acid export membrane protein